MPKTPKDQQKPNKTMDSFSWLFPQSAASINRIERKLDQLMAQVQIDQQALDDFAAEINDSVDAVAAEIQKLVDDANNPLTAADVTALTGAVDKLKGLEPPAVEPVPEPGQEETPAGE